MNESRTLATLRDTLLPKPSNGELAHYNGAILTLRALREAIEKWAIIQDSP